MPVTQVGIVYYADDPDKKVFRVVTPTHDDSELDAPDPQHGEWHVFGLDPARPAVMEKVARSSDRAQLTCNVGCPPTTNGLLENGEPLIPVASLIPDQA
jgi:hypothetical protein